jgi:pimeloyl-ACP methyl ester carboxylesterase
VTGVNGDRLVHGSLGPVRKLAGRRRLVLINRWPGLPSELTMAELARRQADAIRVGFGGEPVDVIGTSTGGSIAQQLAAEHPDVVRRLVLLSTACRLGPEGLRDQAELADLLRIGATRAAGRSAGASLVPRPFAPLAGAAGWVGARRLFGSPQATADLIATLDAEDAFDLAKCEGAISAATLIVAGGRDRFYTRELFERTRELIPGSRLFLRPRRGHVTVGFDPKAAAAIRAFFSD